MRRVITLVLCLFAARAWGVAAESLVLDKPVIDQAQVLEDVQERELATLLENWHREGLMQAAVVVVDSLDGADDFDYAMQLFERWQLGDAKADNGLLVLVAVGERKLRMITGDGTEGLLPDIAAARIQREHITPRFRQGDYAGGLRAGLQAAAEQLRAGEWQVAPEYGRGSAGMSDMMGMWDKLGTAPQRMNRLFLLIFIAAFATSFVARLRGQGRVFRVIYAALTGFITGGIVWMALGSLWIAVPIALATAAQEWFMRNTYATRRRARRHDDGNDDDDDWFGGGVGSSGGFGGGFGGGSSGGFSGGGGSTSGGGAGSSW